ncbi:N-acyl homoserine lactonase family protein [Thermoactinomyces sp. CICC 10522]|uniref:N-acyl homoserine lactonase family protein n=1 Tax=Thermoactinomyces sp. CICC 10522 TaxID=2767427 RepID=UPI0018DBD743|nr:N-acyl homoserine lactonase family protein [Thermoactinomyces sp. CICC 10522]
MTQTWKVIALKMGELTVEKSTLTYFQDFGQSMVIPIWATAVYGGGYNILVDTGIHDVQWVRDNCGPCAQADDEHIVEALKQGLGWSPDDVDIIINTHLHYDHCGNNKLFKKARFILQETEWKAAHNPIPSQKGIYLSELFDSVDYFAWKFVHNEVEVVPGVKVFPTPGHSDGHQSVLVKTEEGNLCISGDVSNLLVNIRENIPAGILTSTKDIFDSMERVRSVADRILPGHEPIIKKYQTCDFPTL